MRPSLGEPDTWHRYATEGTERRGGGGSERKNRKMGRAERRITGEGRGESDGKKRRGMKAGADGRWVWGKGWTRPVVGVHVAASRRRSCGRVEGSERAGRGRG